MLKSEGQERGSKIQTDRVKEAKISTKVMTEWDDGKCLAKIKTGRNMENIVLRADAILARES